MGWGSSAYLYVPRPLVGLVGHPLLDAGQLLLQVGHLVLVQLRQVVQLVLQPLVPATRHTFSPRCRRLNDRLRCYSAGMRSARNRESEHI